MQDNVGWEQISGGYEGLGKAPKWVQRKMRKMVMPGIYELKGRHYRYRIYAHKGQGMQVAVYRKPRGRSRSTHRPVTRRPLRGSNKALVSVLAVIGAVLLLAFLVQVL